MPNLTAAEQAIVSRSGGSSRLLAHRLETYDADEAKNVGSAFESAWRARHGNGVGRQASALPLASPAKSRRRQSQPQAQCRPIHRRRPRKDRK